MRRQGLFAWQPQAELMGANTWRISCVVDPVMTLKKNAVNIRVALEQIVHAHSSTSKRKRPSIFFPPSKHDNDNQT
jgi:hypothetical protein